MTEKYKELKALLDSVETRKQEAMTRVRELRAQVMKLEENYETAIIAGNPTKDITRELRGLRADLADAEQEALVYRTDAKDQAEIIRRDPRVAKLAVEVMQVNTQRVAVLRESFQRLIRELQQIKADYMRRVAEAGALNKQAAALSNEQNNVKKYVPGEENVYFQPGTSGGGRTAGPDEIYINNSEIDKAFKEGDINEKR